MNDTTKVCASDKQNDPKFSISLFVSLIYFILFSITSLAGYVPYIEETDIVSIIVKSLIFFCLIVSSMVLIVSFCEMFVIYLYKRK